ncbi:heptaprenylglyceryl phosphate synthase [Paenibacillus sp. TRM 82003]|nr:heptaprenylglyceryl phosphate synthase [Paenibacillus sp. TRM 82003]
MVEKEIATWKHVFKLDPEKDIDDDALEALCLSGTNAILVGGSSGVTYDNTVDLLARLRRYELPVALEVTTLDAVVPGFDVYLAPIALNASDPDYIVGHHASAMKQYGGVLPWESLAAEGYIIANPDCTAARVASATKPVSEADIVAYARLADRLLRLPIVYLEYSGVFGDMAAVAKAKAALGQARLFYGGGIDGAEKAKAAAEAADTIVVGNIIYSSLSSALDTVRVVQS